MLETPVYSAFPGNYVYVGGVFTQPKSPDEGERYILSLLDILLKPILVSLSLR